MIKGDSKKTKNPDLRRRPCAMGKRPDASTSPQRVSDA